MQAPVPQSDLKNFLDTISQSPPDPNSIRLPEFLKKIPFNVTTWIDLDDCRGFEIIISIIFKAVSTILALGYAKQLLDNILCKVPPAEQPKSYVIILNFILGKLDKELITSQTQFDELFDTMPANIDSANFAAITCGLLKAFKGGTTDVLFNRILGKMPKEITPADYAQVVNLCVERPRISRPPFGKILEKIPADTDSKNYALMVVKLLTTQVSLLNNTDILILLYKMPDSIAADDYSSVFTTLGSLISKLPDEDLIHNLDAIFAKMPENMSPDNFWNVFLRLIGKDHIRKAFASESISDGTLHALNQMPADTNSNVHVYIKELLSSLKSEQLAKITNEHLKALFNEEQKFLQFFEEKISSQIELTVKEASDIFDNVPKSITAQNYIACVLKFLGKCRKDQIGSTLSLFIFTSWKSFPEMDLKTFLFFVSRLSPYEAQLAVSVNISEITKKIPFQQAATIDLEDCNNFKAIFSILFKIQQLNSDMQADLCMKLRVAQELVKDVLQKMSSEAQSKGYMILLNLILDQIGNESLDIVSFISLLSRMPQNIDSASYATMMQRLLNCCKFNIESWHFQVILEKMPTAITGKEYEEVVTLLLQKTSSSSMPAITKILEKMPESIDSDSYKKIIIAVLEKSKHMLSDDIVEIWQKMPKTITANDYLAVINAFLLPSTKLLDISLLDNLNRILEKLPAGISGENFSKVFERLILNHDMVKKTFGLKQFPVDEGTIHALNQMPADGVDGDIKDYIKGLLQQLSSEKLAQITNENVKALLPDRFKQAPAPRPQAKHRTFDKKVKKSSSSTETSDETTDESGEDQGSVEALASLLGKKVGRGVSNLSIENDGSTGCKGGSSTVSEEDGSSAGVNDSNSRSEIQQDSASMPRDDGRDNSRQKVDPVREVQDDGEKAGSGIFSHQARGSGKGMFSHQAPGSGNGIFSRGGKEYPKSIGEDDENSSGTELLDLDLNEDQIKSRSRKTIRYLTGPWSLFHINRFLNFFFRLSTQLIIAALSLSIGFIIMNALPQVAAIVPEVFLGIAMVAPIVGLLAQIVISYLEYARWRQYSSGGFLSHQLSFFTPTTGLGKMFTTLCMLSCGALIGVSIAFFLGNVDCVQALTPFFNVVHDFLAQGVTHIFSVFGLSDIVITAEAANIVGAIFLTTLPLFALEISRRISNLIPTRVSYVSYASLNTDEDGSTLEFPNHEDESDKSATKNFSGFEPLSKSRKDEKPAFEGRGNEKGEKNVWITGR